MKHLMRDKVRLIKSDGSRTEGIQASVQRDMIFTDDASLAIVEGDIFERDLPSGVTERYEVTDAGYYEGIGGIEAHYQSKVRKMTGIPRKERVSTSINIGNFQGILGDVSNSQLTQNLQMTVTAGDFNSLAECLKAAGVENEDIESLKQAIEADPKPASSDKMGPNVSGWIGSMVSKAASGAWKIGSAVAAPLIVKAICAYYGIGV